MQPRVRRVFYHPRTVAEPSERSDMDETTAERWLPVPDYEGLYEVSDQGRVRSLPRGAATYGGRAWSRNGQILKPAPSVGSALTVGLSVGGERRTWRVHTLVLLAFVGPRPDGLQCCHGNGDFADNRLGNLRWDTPSSNMIDRFNHGTDNNHHRRKELCPRGHPMELPNLMSAPWTRRGWRECLACSRAKAAGWRAKRKGLPFDLQSESDRRYEVIMKG